MAKFPRYSLHKLFLILAQRPEASRVSGYRTWQQLGRQVNRGAKGAVLFLLAAASGLRAGELLALRVKDVDFAASSVRVEAFSDQRSAGKIGPCKNVTV